MCSEVLQQITQNPKAEEHFQGQQQKEDSDDHSFNRKGTKSAFFFS